MPTNIITREGHAALKAELDHLWHTYRPDGTEILLHPDWDHDHPDLPDDDHPPPAEPDPPGTPDGPAVGGDPSSDRTLSMLSTVLA